VYFRVQYGVPSINLKYYDIDPNVIRLIPQDTALRYQVVPLSAGRLRADDRDDRSHECVRDGRCKVYDRLQCEPVWASESAIADAISRFYGGAHSNGEELSNLMRDLVEDELELASDEAEMDAAIT